MWPERIHASAAEQGSHRRRIAVALHDIEPATFERCALIRDWLDDHGVDRVTLLVIPARDLHPLGERSPEMAGWLEERRRRGDSIAQHGFQHARPRRGGAFSRQTQAHAHSRRSAEFVGLDRDETRRAVDAGWRVLKLAGIEPDGFVAPAYAYTPALRQVLPAKFRWWASLLRLHDNLAGPSGGPRQLIAPAWGAGTESPLRRALSPVLIRAGSLLGGNTIRLDLHPSDVQHTRYMMALERAFTRTEHQHEAITYDELLPRPDALARSPGPPFDPRLPLDQGLDQPGA
jgi:predicted deacetylase